MSVKPMKSNEEAGTCKHPACSCMTEGPEYCSKFCETVETSENMQQCGCGHTSCDMTGQIGNENTFSSTAS